MTLRSQYSAAILALAVGCTAVGLLLGVVLTSAFYLRKSSSLVAELETKSERLLLLEQVLPQLAQLTRSGAASAEFEAVSSAQAQRAQQAAQPVPSAADSNKAPSPKAKAAVGAQPASPQGAQARPTASAQARVTTLPAVPGAVSQSPSPPPTSQSVASSGAREKAADAARQGATGTADAVNATVVPPAVTSEELAASVKNRLEGVPADKVGVARIDAGGVHLASGRYIRVGERFSTGERLLKVDPANDRVVTSERQLLLFFNR
jgi:hypothetical protein